MRTLRLAVLLLLASGCGDKVEGGLTGVDIVVTYQPDIAVNKLEFSGWYRGQPAFDGDARPKDDRIPSPEGENLVVLLDPSTMADATIFLRVDGVDTGGSLVGSTGAQFTVTRGATPRIELHLGEPRQCGDGVLHPDAEPCDDGNQLGEDGCTGECVVEDEWECGGEPSRCRMCGNDICEVGEDLCNCSQDCDSGTCGDGSCCEELGETVCNCGDCTSMDACDDGVCCGGEIDTCGMSGDCRDCGDGTCDAATGEDFCSCPSDCDLADPPALNNGVCCTEAGENIDDNPADCCPPGANVADGVCCPNETAETNPADCCAVKPRCDDSVCCPGEDESCTGCCDNTCRDGVCCTERGETSGSCTFDCCPDCSGVALDCAGGCCASECPAGAECDFDCHYCTCEFACDADSRCDVDCTYGGCAVQCAPGAMCNVICGGGFGWDGGPTTGDGGVGGGAPTPGTCVCYGAGCNLTCAGPQLDCKDGGIACGSCPP